MGMIRRLGPREVNGVSLNLYSDIDFQLGPRIPGTNLFLHPNTTIREVFDAAGYKTYDTALPIGWVKAKFSRDDGGYDVPKGVWCYDEGYGIMGQFVSLDEALEKLGRKLNELGG